MAQRSKNERLRLDNLSASIRGSPADGQSSFLGFHVNGLGGMHVAHGAALQLGPPTERRSHSLTRAAAGPFLLKVDADVATAAVNMVAAMLADMALGKIPTCLSTYGEHCEREEQAAARARDVAAAARAARASDAAVAAAAARAAAAPAPVGGGAGAQAAPPTGDEAGAAAAAAAAASVAAAAVRRAQHNEVVRREVAEHRKRGYATQLGTVRPVPANRQSLPETVSLLQARLAGWLQAEGEAERLEDDVRTLVEGLVESLHAALQSAPPARAGYDEGEPQLQRGALSRACCHSLDKGLCKVAGAFGCTDVSNPGPGVSGKCARHCSKEGCAVHAAARRRRAGKRPAASPPEAAAAPEAGTPAAAAAASAAAAAAGAVPPGGGRARPRRKAAAGVAAAAAAAAPSPPRPAPPAAAPPAKRPRAAQREPLDFDDDGEKAAAAAAKAAAAGEAAEAAELPSLGHVLGSEVAAPGAGGTAGGQADGGHN